MATSIDDRIVRLQFQNSEFEKGVKETLKSLEELKKGLKFDDATSGLEDLQKAGDSFSLAKIADEVERINERFSLFGRIGGKILDELANKAVGLGKSIVNSVTQFSIGQFDPGWGKYEEKTRAVQTIMNATGESIDVVNAQLERLNWFSDETSYSFVDMTSNVGKFTSVGMGLEESATAMQGIATWAALSGAGSTEASRAMYNISQALGAGAMKKIDWKSIENANMATAEFKQTAIDTAIAMGVLDKTGKTKGGKGMLVTVENFSETLAKGWLDSNVMMATLENYGSYANEIYELVSSGKADNAADAIEMLADKYDTLGARAFRAAQEAKTLTDMVEATTDAVSSQFMSIFESIFGDYEQAKKFWTDMANDMYDIFASPLADLADTFDIWSGLNFGGRSDFIEGLTAIADTIVTIMDQIRKAVHSVVPGTIFDPSVEMLQGISMAVKEFGLGMKDFFKVEEQVTGSHIETLFGRDQIFNKDEAFSEPFYQTTEGIRLLQIRLQQLGYDYVGVTGEMDTATKDAVKAFKSKWELAIDDVYDEATHHKLIEKVLETDKQVVEEFKGELKRGLKGEEVELLQKQLMALGYDVGTMGADGIFGPRTEKALNQLKEKYGLTIDGIYDEATHSKIGEALIDMPRELAENFDEELKNGSKGQGVKELQTRLKELGYDTGVVDGIFGPKTEAALKAFEENAGETVDGIYDEATHKNLIKALFPDYEWDTGNGTQEVEDKIEVLSNPMITLTNIAKLAASALDVVGQVIGFVGSVAVEIGKTLWPIAGLVVGLISDILQAVVGFDTVIKKTGLFEKALLVVKSILKPIQDVLAFMSNLLLNLLRGNIDAVRASLQNIYDTIKNSKALADLKKGFENLKKALVPVYPVIKSVATGFMSFLGKTFNTVISTAGKSISWIGDILIKFGSTAIGVITSWVGKIPAFIDKIKTFFGGFISVNDDSLDKPISVFEKIKNFFARVREFLVGDGSAEPTKQGVLTRIGKLLSGDITGFAEGLDDSTHDRAVSVLEAIKKFFADVGALVTSVIDGAMFLFAGKMREGTSIDKEGKIFQTLEFIKGALDKVIDGIVYLFSGKFRSGSVGRLGVEPIKALHSIRTTVRNLINSVLFLFTGSESAGSKLSSSWEGVKKIIDKIRNTIGAFIDSIRFLFTGVHDDAGRLQKDGFAESLIIKVKDIFNRFVESIRFLFTGVHDEEGSLSEGGKAESFIGKIHEIIHGFTAALSLLFHGTSDDTVDLGIGEKIVDVVRKIREIFAKFIDGIVYLFTGTFRDGAVIRLGRGPIVQLYNIRKAVKNVIGAIKYLFTGVHDEEGSLKEGGKAESFIDGVKNTFNNFVAAVSILFNGAVEGVSNLGLGEKVVNVLNNIHEIFSKFINAVMYLFSGSKEAGEKLIGGNIDVKGFIEKIRTTIGAFIDSVKYLFTGVHDQEGKLQEGGKAESFIDGVKNTVTGFITAVSILFNGAVEGASNLGLGEKVVNALDKIHGIFAKVIDGIVYLFTGAFRQGAVSRLGRGPIVLLYNIRKVFANVVGAIKYLFTGVHDQAGKLKDGGKVESLIDGIKNAVHKVITAIEILFNGTGQAATDLGISETAVNVLNKIHEIFSSFVDAVASLFKGSESDASEISEDGEKPKSVIEKIFHYVQAFIEAIVYVFTGVHKESGVLQEGGKAESFIDGIKNIVQKVITAIGVLFNGTDQTAADLGISETVVNVLNKIHEIFSGFISAVMSLFKGGESEASEIVEEGEKPKSVIDKIFHYVKAFIEAIVYVFTGVHKESGVLQEGGKAESLIDGVKNAVHNFITAVGVLFNGTNQDASQLGLSEKLVDILKSIHSTVKKVIDTIKYLFTGTIGNDSSLQSGDRIVTIIDDVKAFILKIVDAVKLLFGKEIDQETSQLSETSISRIQNFHSVLVKIFGLFKDAAIGIWNTIKGLATGEIKFESIGDFFKTTWEKLKGFFEKIKSSLSEGINFKSIGDKLKNFFKGLGDAFKNGFNIAKFVAIGALVVVIITKIIGVIFSVTSVGRALRKVLKKFSDEADDKEESKSTAVLKFAMSVALIAGSLYLLSTVPTEGLIKAGVVVGTIMATLVGITILLSKKVSKEAAEAFKTLGNGMLQIAASIAILSGTMYLLGKFVDDKTFESGIGKLITILGTIGIFLIVVSQAGGGNTSFKGLWDFATAVGILAGLTILLGRISWKTFLSGVWKLALIMVILGKVMSGISKAGGQKVEWKGLVQFGICVGILSLTAAMLGKMDGRTFLQGLLGVSLIMLAMRRAMKIISKAGGTTIRWKGLIGFGTAIAILGGTAMLLGKMDLISLIKGIGAVSVLMLLLRGVMAKMAKLGATQIKWKGIVGAATAIGLIGLIYIEIMKYTNQSSLGAVIAAIAAINTIIGSFSKILKRLAELGKVKFDKETAKAMTSAVFELVLLTGAFALLAKLLEKTDFVTFGEAMLSFSKIIKSFGQLATTLASMPKDGVSGKNIRGMISAIVPLAALAALFAGLAWAFSRLDPVGFLEASKAFTQVLNAFDKINIILASFRNRSKLEVSDVWIILAGTLPMLSLASIFVAMAVAFDRMRADAFIRAQGAFENITTSLETIAKTLKEVGKSIKIQSVWGLVASTLSVLALALIFVGIGYAFSQLDLGAEVYQRTGDTLKTLVSSVAKLAGALKGITGENSIDIGSAFALIPAVIAVGILGLAFAALARLMKGVDYNSFTMALTALKAIIKQMGNVTQVISGFSIGSWKDIAGLFVMFIGISGAMIAFGYAVSLMKDVDPGVILAFALAIGIMIAAFSTLKHGKIDIMSALSVAVGIAVAVGLLGLVLGGLAAAFLGLLSIPGVKDFLRGKAKEIGEIVGAFIGAMQATQLQTYASGLNGFAQAMEDIEFDLSAGSTLDKKVTDATAMSEKLTEFFQKLPPVSWINIAGQVLNKLFRTDFDFSATGQFAQDMENYAGGLSKFAEIMGGVKFGWETDEEGNVIDNLEGFEERMTTINTMSGEMAKFFDSLTGMSMTEMGAEAFNTISRLVFGNILGGENGEAPTIDLSATGKFANDLQNYAEGLSTFASIMGGVEFKLKDGGEVVTDIKSFSDKMTIINGMSLEMSNMFDELSEMSGWEIGAEIANAGLFAWFGRGKSGGSSSLFEAITGKSGVEEVPQVDFSATGKFATDLQNYADGLATFASIMGGVEFTLPVSEAMSDLAEGVAKENENAEEAELSGNSMTTDIEVFAARMKALNEMSLMMSDFFQTLPEMDIFSRLDTIGTALLSFAADAVGVDADAEIDTSATAQFARDLQNYATGIQSFVTIIGGIDTDFSEDSDLRVKAKNMNAMSAELNSFLRTLAPQDSFQKLAAMANAFLPGDSKIEISAASQFSQDIQTYAAGMKSFIRQIRTINLDSTDKDGKSLNDKANDIVEMSKNLQSFLSTLPEQNAFQKIAAVANLFLPDDNQLRSSAAEQFAYDIEAYIAGMIAFIEKVKSINDAGYDIGAGGAIRTTAENVNYLSAMLRDFLGSLPQSSDFEKIAAIASVFAGKKGLFSVSAASKFADDIDAYISGMIVFIDKIVGINDEKSEDGKQKYDLSQNGPVMSTASNIKRLSEMLRDFLGTLPKQDSLELLSGFVSQVLGVDWSPSDANAFANDIIAYVGGMKVFLDDVVAKYVNSGLKDTEDNKYIAVAQNVVKISEILRDFLGTLPSQDDYNLLVEFGAKFLGVDSKSTSSEKFADDILAYVGGMTAFLDTIVKPYLNTSMAKGDSAENKYMSVANGIVKISEIIKTFLGTLPAVEDVNLLAALGSKIITGDANKTAAEQFSEDIVAYVGGLESFITKAQELESYALWDEESSLVKTTKGMVGISTALRDFVNGLGDSTVWDTVANNLGLGKVDNFSQDMQDFVGGISTFATEMQGITFDAEVESKLNNAITVAEKVRDFVLSLQGKGIQRSGGAILQLFTEKTEQSTIFENISELGENINSFAYQMSTVSTTDDEGNSILTQMDSAIAVAEKIKEFIVSLKGAGIERENGVIQGLFTNETTQTTVFGAIGRLAQEVNAAHQYLEPLDESIFQKLSIALNVTKAVTDLLGYVSKINQNGEMGNGAQGVNESLQFIYDDTDGLSALVTGIVEKMVEAEGKLKETYGTDFSLSEITESVSAFASLVASLYDASLACDGIAFDQLTDGYNIAVNFCQGLYNGIVENQESPTTAAYNLGRALVASTQAALDENSPSKEAEAIGGYFGDGLAIGLNNKVGTIEDSSEAMTSSLIETARTTLTTLSGLLSEGIDDDPVITPIIDLTNAKLAAGSLNGMFGDRSLAINASRDLAGKAVDIDTGRVSGISANLSASSELMNSLRDRMQGLETAIKDIGGNEDVVNEVRQMSNNFGSLGQAVASMKITLDTGVLVGQITPQVDAQLGVLAMRRDRGN